MRARRGAGEFAMRIFYALLLHLRVLCPCIYIPTACVCLKRPGVYLLNS